MKEEKYIIDKCGKINPFKVPEGYFDTLTERVMANIPANETKTVSIAPKSRSHWLQWSGLVAACMVGALLCVNIFDKQGQDEQTQLMSKASSANEVIYDESYQEDALNYAMVDYNDVYNYLSGNGY